MCRLYGFRSNEPTKVECTLVRSQNALLLQSREDRRGVSHPDGWGIAAYDGGPPRVEKRSCAAFAGQHFSLAAERVFARVVVAHVRRATVGGAALENCHPFVLGRWTLAHNGTVTAFEHVGPRLAAETDDDLLAERRGTTDSEAVFLWLLSRLRRGGNAPERPAGARGLAAFLGEAVRSLERLCAAEGASEPARLNLVLTDGRSLVASRLGNSLHWTVREGLHDCEVCGVPHVRHEAGSRYRAVVIASEPLSEEPWEELPEGGLLAVDPGMEITVLAA